MRITRTALAAALAAVIVATILAISGCMAPVDSKQATGTAELDPTVPAKTASQGADAANQAVGDAQQAVGDLEGAGK